MMVNISPIYNGLNWYLIRFRRRGRRGVQFLIVLLLCYVQSTHSRKASDTFTATVHGTEEGIGIANIRHNDYAPDASVEVLAKMPDLLQKTQEKEFFFPKFQSPTSIQRLVDGIIHCHQNHGKTSSLSKSSHSRSSLFHKHIGPNYREGYIRSTKLPGTDWVIAESKQIVVDCTTEDVLKAYLSGALQTIWNQDKVINSHFTLKQNSSTSNNNNKNNEQCLYPYYQQDLVLKSQRVITSHTGIMRYSQKIIIDKIITNDNNNRNAKYCVSIQMMDPKTSETTITTMKKPFEALYVHVNLEPSSSSSSFHDNHDSKKDNNDNSNNGVYVYAAGLLKVNRKVVPNLVVFDASGIAGSMAGKGTLWLTAYFKQRQLEKLQQQQQQQLERQEQEQHESLSRRRSTDSAAVLACHLQQRASSSSSSSSTILVNHNIKKNRRFHIKLSSSSWQHLLLPPYYSAAALL